MLGKRIAELRNKMGLSQYELADRLGFSRGKLANYEQGQRQPDYDTLQKIADFFDVTIDYLITGKERVKEEDNNSNLFFFDKDDLTEEDIEDIKRHIKYVKWQAKERKKSDGG